MKHIFITSIFLFLFMGCIEETEEMPSINEIIICGNKIKENETLSKHDAFTNSQLISKEISVPLDGISLINNSLSRSNSISLLSQGAEISFFSRNGLESNGEILTYNGSYWEGETKMKWEEGQHDAFVKAYYPPLPDTPEEFYNSEGQLNDVLIAQGNYPAYNPICLEFKHLFSKITFQIDSNLNDSLESFIITPLINLTGIEPYQARLETVSFANTTDTEEAHQLCYSYSPDGLYTVILPSGEGISVNVQIHTKDKRNFQKQLTNMKCEQGHAYLCKLGKKDNHIGIYTAEDFIAFTHLINNQPYKNRSLNEFGITKNGQTTYYLKNNITFTDNDQREVMQIGCHLNTNSEIDNGFKDTFDGQGHYLANFLIRPDSYSFSGLFQKILPDGIVKSLTLKRVKPIVNNGGNSMAILCGENYGLIHNCKLEDVSITMDLKDAGGLVSQNNGTIVNCIVDQLHIIFNKKKSELALKVSGIASCNGPNKKIINCGISHISYEGPKTINGQIVGICHGNQGIISNCVADYFMNEVYPLCVINFNKISCCYHTKGAKNSSINSPQGSVKEHVYVFADTRNDREKTATLLNKWIHMAGEKNYPNLDFIPWTVGEKSIITLDSH